MRTAYITHPDCLGHDAGAGHPERPERLRAIQDRLVAAHLMDLLRQHEAPEATREQLLRVHHPAYVDRIHAAAPQEGRAQLDPDTGMGPGSLAAAYRAAGAAVDGVDRVLADEYETVFCAVRPPGHHAEPDRAMGFCLFNNVAVAAAHALGRHGLARVAIVDFDGHHGNGTQRIFQDDDRILYCSTFEHPFYPFSDPATAPDNAVLMPLHPGATGADFCQAMEERGLPALERFAPELLLISAGFDAHKEDDLTHLRLDDGDFAWVSREVMAVAGRHAGNRVVSVLEGGYNLDALGRSAAVHIRALMGI